MISVSLLLYPSLGPTLSALADVCPSVRVRLSVRLLVLLSMKRLLAICYCFLSILINRSASLKWEYDV